MKVDNVLNGILVGIACPILGFALVAYIFDMLTYAGLMDATTSSSDLGRRKTVWLLGICCNLIPINVFKIKRYDNAMRGMIFPTLAYVAWWLYTYSSILFQ